MQLRTNLRRPNRYREDDVPDLPPNPIFVVPTIPYDPTLRPAVFPTLSLDQNPPESGSENLEAESANNKTTRRRAFVFRDQRTVPLPEPMDGLVQLPNSRWVATEEPGEYDAYNAYDWNVDDYEDQTTAPEERWFPPGTFERIDWCTLSDGMQLVIIKEFANFLPFSETVEFLCLEEEDIRYFIHLCQSEIRIREDEENRIARATERQMNLLMSGNWSAGNSEWEDILQQEMFDGIGAEETPATFLISRSQIEDAKAFLMDFRTREEFPDENGPLDEDINNIPTYVVMKEILGRLDSCLGADLSFEELNYGDEILNYFPPDDGQTDMLASYEAALGAMQQEETLREEVPEEVQTLSATISKPPQPKNRSAKKDKDAITFGPQPTSEKKPHGHPFGRASLPKPGPSRLREVFTADDFESESQDSFINGEQSSTINVNSPCPTEGPSYQTPSCPMTTRKVSSVGRNPFIEHTSTGPPPRHTAAFHMDLPAQPAPRSSPKTSRSSTSPLSNELSTPKPLSPSSLVQIAQSSLKSTASSPVSNDTHYASSQVNLPTPSRMTQSNHSSPSMDYSFSISTPPAASLGANPQASASQTTRPFPTSAPKTFPASVPTSLPVESPVFYAPANHASQFLHSSSPTSSPTSRSSSAVNASSPPKNPKIKLNFTKKTPTGLSPQQPNDLDMTRSEASTVPQNTTVATTMGTSQAYPSSTTHPDMQNLKQSTSSNVASTAVPLSTTRKPRTKGTAPGITGEERQLPNKSRNDRSGQPTTSLSNKMASSAPTAAKRARMEELDQSLQAEGQPAAKRPRLQGTQGSSFTGTLMKGAKAIGSLFVGKSDSGSGVESSDFVSDQELETPLDMPSTPSRVHLSEAAMNFGKAASPSSEKTYKSPYQQRTQRNELAHQLQHTKSIGSYVMEEVGPDDSKRLGAPSPILEEKTRAAAQRARHNSESSATDDEISRTSSSPSKAKVVRNQASGASIQVLIPKRRNEEMDNSSAPETPLAKKQRTSRAGVRATSPSTIEPRANSPAKQRASSATKKSTPQSNAASQTKPAAKQKPVTQPKTTSQSKAYPRKTAPQAEATSQTTRAGSAKRSVPPREATSKTKAVPKAATPQPKAGSTSKSTTVTAAKSKAKQGPKS